MKILNEGKIALPVIKRLPRYYRYVKELREKDVKTVSSKELAGILGTTASQVRQDFNCFGGFGQQGIGYSVELLYTELERLLFGGREFNAVLLGAGKLGQAITRFFPFEARGFKLDAIFDNAPSLIGKAIDGIKVTDVSALRAYCEKNNPDVAVFCLPKQAAEELAPILISSGVKSFWNFSHFDLTAHSKDILVENVHLADSLLSLEFLMRDEGMR